MVGTGVDPEPMRFLTPDEVATLADTIDGRYDAFEGLTLWVTLRLVPPRQ